MRTWITAFLLVLVLQHAASAQTAADPERMRATIMQSLPEAVALYREFLALPNDGRHPEHIAALVDWMEPQFQARGFRTQRLPTAVNPTLYAERLVANAERTVLVYLQSDGQPVDPSAWAQPNPYQPVLKRQDDHGDWEIIEWSALEREFDPDWRIFARSAADSKGPMTQFLLAMDLLAGMDAEPNYNLKVIIDTEEELGSPHLAALVEQHRERLAADLLLIFDGPPHASNQPTVSFGARGLLALTLTTFGPKVPQHSGHYGNFVPNPAFDLARILASMKSAEGRVLISGFYDGVAIDANTAAALARVPDDPEQILGSIGVAAPEQVADTLQQALQYPSLNIRGMGSAWIGDQVRTIIPATATAEIDIRLVLESDPDRLAELVRAHIEDLGYTVVDHPPTDAQRAQHERIVQFSARLSYAAFRSEFDSAPGRMARSGMRWLYGEEPILIRTMGGSIPISPFVQTLGIPAASVPTVNIDNNQHSPNENLRLGNFVEGIAIIAAVLSQRP